MFDSTNNNKQINVRNFMIREEREQAWSEFLESFSQNSQLLSSEEILEFIHSIHEYSYWDHSVNHSYNSEQLFKALHYMSWIAYFFASEQLNASSIDPHEFLSKNLFLCISALENAFE